MAAVETFDMRVYINCWNISGNPLTFPILRFPGVAPECGRAAIGGFLALAITKY